MSNLARLRNQACSWTSPTSMLIGLTVGDGLVRSISAAFCAASSDSKTIIEAPLVSPSLTQCPLTKPGIWERRRDALLPQDLHCLFKVLNHAPGDHRVHLCLPFVGVRRPADQTMPRNGPSRPPQTDNLGGTTGRGPPAGRRRGLGVSGFVPPDTKGAPGTPPPVPTASGERTSGPLRLRHSLAPRTPQDRNADARSAGRARHRARDSGLQGWSPQRASSGPRKMRHRSPPCSPNATLMIRGL